MDDHDLREVIDGRTIQKVRNDTIVSGRVNDTPRSFRSGIIKPVQLTPQGRVRVDTSPSWDGQVWHSVAASGAWGGEVTFTMNGDNLWPI